MEESLGRYSKHLANWNVDFSKDRWTLGEDLMFDAATEKFVGGNHLEKANQLVKPEQREKYAVPAVV